MQKLISTDPYISYDEYYEQRFEYWKLDGGDLDSFISEYEEDVVDWEQRILPRVINSRNFVVVLSVSSLSAIILVCVNLYAKRHK